VDSSLNIRSAAAAALTRSRPENGATGKAWPEDGKKAPPETTPPPTPDRVVNPETKELIRQIPSAEVLVLARVIGQEGGRFIHDLT